MSSDSLDPLRLLQEDLKSDDYETIIASVNRLTTVALALGPARTRSELVPFLLEFSDSDNDEAQTSVARQLSDFTELVGGPAQLPVLLPLLEKLCGEEEFVVRDQAVNSLNNLIGKFPKAEVPVKFVPLLKRLANGDWFTTRVSACGLFAASYPHCPEPIQAEFRSLFNNLCNDDTPMVRKAAFQNLGKFALVLQRQFFKSDVYPIVKAVSTDEMDSMRLYAIDSCAALAKVVDSAEYASVLLPIVESLQDDTSWRVRQALAQQYVEVCGPNQPEASAKKLVAAFARLLRDKESEVRVATADKVEIVANTLKFGLTEFLAPALEQTVTDPSQPVRVSLSRAIVGLCPVFGKDNAAKIIVPLVQQLAKDEYYEVRNHVITRLDVLSDAIGSAGIANSILPQLIDLAKDPKWRVRMGVIEKSSMLAQQLGVKNFEKRLQPVIIGALSDHVYAIREVACQQMGLIVKEFGGKWAAEKFLPQAFQIYDKTTNYLHRMTCLLVIERCAEPGGAELIEKTLLPIAVQACTDDVANIRIAAAKTLDELAQRSDKKFAQSKIAPLLQKLTTDADPDVQFFSAAAIKKLS